MKQLSLFGDIEGKCKRKFLRDSVGRFATKQTADLERAKRESEYYKFMYEAEARKNAPLLRALCEKDRELNHYKNKVNGN